MTTDRSPVEWSLAVRQHEAVASLGQLGLRSTDLEEFLRASMLVAMDTLGVSSVVLFELLEAEQLLTVRAGRANGKPVTHRRARGIKLPVGPGSLPGFALEQPGPVRTSDLAGDVRFTAQAPSFGLELRAALAAPIDWHDQPWGVLAVYDNESRQWSDDEVHFVQSIANTMGLAIQRSSVERDLRESSARLDLSLDAGGLGTWSWDIFGDRLVLNDAARAIYGLTATSFSGSGADFMAVVHPEDRARFPDGRESASQPAPDHHHLFRIIRPDTGELRWIESWGRPSEDGPAALHLVGVCSDVTERHLAEQHRAALHEREHQALVAAEQARERLAFLSEASAVLSSSLDPEVTLASLGELCVPSLAQVCLIDLVGEDGFLQDQVALGATEVVLHDALLLRKRRKELGGAAPTSTGHLEALRGSGIVYHSIDDSLLVQAAADADHLALFRRFDARSTVLAPMVARGRVIGVITLVRTGEQPLYDDDDLAFVEDLAARAALAVENGRLFHSRNRVARSLQAALLPPAMPAIPGLSLAARYNVAETDVAIGGDFYDVIHVGSSAWGVVVGDVCGRGPDAAALTGLVRHTLRTAVVREQQPSRVLGQTNQAMLDQIDETRFCTAAYLSVELADPPSGRVRVVASSAGHPRPVLVRVGGTAAVLECAGTLLGVVEDPLLVDVEVELAPGDAMVLYTDGVTEARRGNDLFGEHRLLETLGGLAGRSAEDMASGLETAVADFRTNASDDMAILVMTVEAPP